MTKAERKAEFDRRAEGSVELARNTVQNALTWSERIADGELSTEEHAAELDALRELYLVFAPITAKHLQEE